MKTIKLFILLAALICTTTSWAQSPTIVRNESELTAAVQTDNAQIQFANDIDIANLLEITGNRTVTIDMKGYTLDRGCTSRGSQVIVIRSGSTLNLSNGTLTGGWGGNGGALDIETNTTVNLTDVIITGNTANDRGGGISNSGTLTMTGGAITGNTSIDNVEIKGGGGLFNYSGATATLTNVTISGNESKVSGGGGIHNEGTSNLTNVIVTGNTANDHGGGIANSGTLTITGGTITDNISNDKADPSGGGGLFNASNGTATLTNVTITGNSVAKYGGSGICNYGTLTLDGGTITGNSAKSDGGGIWTNGTLNIQGAMTITGNTIANGQASNLYLKSGKVVTVTGSLVGSNIGIYMLSTGTFTNGYSTYHSGTDPATIFTSDQNSNVSMDSNGQEAQIDFFYIERGWDEENNVVTKTTCTLPADGYTVLTGGGDINLNPGFYAVKGNVTYNFLYMVNGGEHHLILCDGASLNAKHINVEGDNTLQIYGQIKDLGMIDIKDYETHTSHAGIGGNDASAGTIVIHGGNIDAKGCLYGDIQTDFGGAGIGGGGGGYNYHGAWSEGGGGGGTVIVYGGNVLAVAGGVNGAGIGGSHNGNGGNVTIHGGNVTARGGRCGAGIGTGRNENDIMTSTGSLTVTGGHVEAFGGSDAAGIGGGRDADGSVVTISGGYVFTKGGSCGAGIGSGCEALTSSGVDGGQLTVTGGTVQAYGGGDAAGIGGGEDADGGVVTITGGNVYAEGKEEGAGIGGGEEGNGGNVTITGGTVVAKAGRDEEGYRAIGPGKGSSNYGQLTLGDRMMVSSERLATAEERKGFCWYRTQARIEPCTHPNATYTVDGINADDHHTEHCLYCTTQFAPELHHFENDSCTVCHVHGSISTISIYLPDIHADSSYTDGIYQSTPTVYNMVTNSTFNFPAAPQDPRGMDFAGWKEGNTTGLTTFIAGDDEDLHLVGSSFTVSQDVSFTSRFHKINLFNKAGYWNVASNWFWGEVPTNGSDVVIGAAATIPDNYIAIADSIAIDGGSITIADGGQLIHNNADVTATVQKAITGHGGNNESGWNFIASPMTNSVAPSAQNGLASGNYDLYFYDEGAHYWRNHKQDSLNLYPGFSLSNGQGYLYANETTTILSFTGTLQAGIPLITESDTTYTYTVDSLSYACGNENLRGWNLVGNPFACNATINRSAYVINGRNIEAYEGGQKVLAPCEGVMVQATASSQSVTFTKVTPAAQASQPNNSSLQITLSQVPEPVEGREGPVSKGVGVSTGSTTLVLDNAIVSFTEGNDLEKFIFNADNAKIYIPQNGKDYAIASVSAGRDGVHTVSTTEVPVNFKAKENGTYTITVNPEGVNLAYLHLIDNMTGADVDLLVPEPVEGPASYTFTAKTTDYESRFKLVFASVCEDADGDNEHFAFISNGKIIVNGTGTLQIVDVLGRVILTREVTPNSSLLTPNSPGVYVLRLINGNDIKTQKIIIQ